MQYNFQPELIKPGQVIRYHLLRANAPLSFKEVMVLLRDDEEFRTFYNQVLMAVPFEGFYWEHPPHTLESMGEKYEVSLINGDVLTRLQADSSAFSRYFETDRAVVSFQNLGKDARLVVPVPQGPDQNYTHLANFVRRAAPQQVQEFWKRVGTEVLGALSEMNLWLNTAGLGVHWLHIRLDSRPKYYKLVVYKNARR